MAVGLVNDACHTAPGQTVISGEREAVAAAVDACEDLGGGTVPLPVTIPFHCELLRPIVQPFARLVEAAPIVPPALPVIDNVTAQPFSDAASVGRSLVAQLTAPVRWEESARCLVNAGTERFIQRGPGDHLLGFVRRIARGARYETFERAAASVAPEH